MFGVDRTAGDKATRDQYDKEHKASTPVKEPLTYSLYVWTAANLSWTVAFGNPSLSPSLRNPVFLQPLCDPSSPSNINQKSQDPQSLHMFPIRFWHLCIRRPKKRGQRQKNTQASGKTPKQGLQPLVSPRSSPPMEKREPIGWFTTRIPVAHMGLFHWSKRFRGILV